MRPKALDMHVPSTSSQSIAVNLKSREGREIIRKVCLTSAAVLCGFTYLYMVACGVSVQLIKCVPVHSMVWCTCTVFW